MKSALYSKTIWFNILTGIVTIAAAFFGYIPDPGVEAKVMGTLIVLQPFVNIALRFFTSKEIRVR